MHRTGECVSVHEGMASWDCLHVNRRRALLRKHDVGVPPALA